MWGLDSSMILEQLPRKRKTRVQFSIQPLRPHEVLPSPTFIPIFLWRFIPDSQPVENFKPLQQVNIYDSSHCWSFHWIICPNDRRNAIFLQLVLNSGPLQQVQYFRAISSLVLPSNNFPWRKMHRCLYNLYQYGAINRKWLMTVHYISSIYCTNHCRWIQI